MIQSNSLHVMTNPEGDAVTTRTGIFMSLPCTISFIVVISARQAVQRSEMFEQDQAWAATWASH